MTLVHKNTKIQEKPSNKRVRPILLLVTLSPVHGTIFLGAVGNTMGNDILLVSALLLDKLTPNKLKGSSSS